MRRQIGPPPSELAAQQLAVASVALGEGEVDETGDKQRGGGRHKRATHDLGKLPFLQFRLILHQPVVSQHFHLRSNHRIRPRQRYPCFSHVSKASPDAGGDPGHLWMQRDFGLPEMIPGHVRLPQIQGGLRQDEAT